MVPVAHAQRVRQGGGLLCGSAWVPAGSGAWTGPPRSRRSPSWIIGARTSPARASRARSAS